MTIHFSVIVIFSCSNVWWCVSTKKWRNIARESTGRQTWLRKVKCYSLYYSRHFHATHTNRSLIESITTNLCLNRCYRCIILCQVAALCRHSSFAIFSAEEFSDWIRHSVTVLCEGVSVLHSLTARGLINTQQHGIQYLFVELLTSIKQILSEYPDMNKKTGKFP